ncbi:MAG: DUF1236 domain-containing protein [Roseiarcus sp.]
MTGRLIKFGTVALLLLAPIGSRAQGVNDGAADGAAQGRADGGPVGAVIGGVIGGVVGGVVGGVDGLLGIDQRPDFRDYVDRQHHPSDSYRAEVCEGNVLPEDGIRYYDVPSRYGVRGYRYAVVNNKKVLVDPMDRKIVQVVD